ncbi:DEAD/H helicase [Schizopora paradoxa]|uniref:DEAD/H helicase n=1 Tax=Schizopora paradoxa TaxID=27342 RepID=A0A0H2RFU5_9AGAM|nr:DEAD/H helicase [Schizopora paradoxa]
MAKRKTTQVDSDDLDNASDCGVTGSNVEAGPSSSKKQRGTATNAKKGKGKKKALNQSTDEWPEYFKSLFKIYKSFNTVLAFCSSRKHLAVTFPTVRSSVEAILKQPLQLNKVAEIKTILPDLLRFAYILQDDLRVNDASPEKGRADPGFERFMQGNSDEQGSARENEHVLVLDFVSHTAGKTSDSQAFQLPPALTPAQVTKLIERRNERFVEAVNELINATPSGEDPVQVLQAAARDHVPINPTAVDVLDEQGPQTIPNSNERASIEELIEDIKLSNLYRDQIVDRRIFPAKEARLGQVSQPLSDAIMDALRQSRKITEFYIHQSRAIDAIRQGKHVIVSTSTASGKSVIYQVPVLNFLEESHESTAIFIYPTKALAQDQRIALEQLLWSCEGLTDIQVANYDGDTSKDARLGIRESASVIFTNFDMLHMSILPHEEQWRKFFRNLKLVAVDELHYYTGVFGSHVAYIIRRLRRLCAAVGNTKVTFVSCSATIANPGRHMRDIFGVEDVEVITDDGAPSGRKDFLIWNPPFNDPLDPRNGRRSPMSEATRLMRFLMKRGVRCILFCKIRKICEQAMKMLRTDLTGEGRIDILDRVKAYRGGYSREDRRKIEQDAFSGNLLGIVATNALELGVDIGVLDAVIMLGYPFGLASLRQQAGRAGRRSRDALAVLVAETFALDQYYVQNPNELHDRAIDELFVDLDSKIILEAHLHCAAFEMPLSAADVSYFGPSMIDICNAQLKKDEDNWYHPNPKFLPFPSQHVSIRGIQEETYCVIDVTRMDRPKLLEEIEFHRALFETYEGAVFIHQGESYLVNDVSHNSKTANLIKTNVNWVTKPREFSDVDAVQTRRIREIKGSPHRAYYGQIDLKTIIFGYYKIREGTILDKVDMETLPFERTTTGFWIDVPRSVLEFFSAKRLNPAEAIHAAEHAFLNQFPLQADVRTECKVAIKEYKTEQSSRQRPARLIFYDSAGTQGSIAAKAFDHVSDILYAAFEAIESCACEDGCAKCIISSYCKENNEVASKLGAQVLLRGVLGLPIDADAIPEQEDGSFTVTIVEAQTVRAVEGVEVELYIDGP